MRGKAHKCGPWRLQASHSALGLLPWLRAALPTTLGMNIGNVSKKVGDCAPKGRDCLMSELCHATALVSTPPWSHAPPLTIQGPRGLPLRTPGKIRTKAVDGQQSTGVS